MPEEEGGVLGHPSDGGGAGEEWDGTDEDTEGWRKQARNRGLQTAVRHHMILTCIYNIS